MSPFLLKIVKRFLPQVKEIAYPTITDLLHKTVDSVSLQAGEDNACATISQYNGEWWVFVVTMSPENKVIRTINSMKLEDMISLGFSKLEEHVETK